MNKNIFQKKQFVILFSLMTVTAWASAFPLIKLGFREFAIDVNNAGGKTLFAGIRFLLAGIITIIIAKSQKRSFKISEKKDIVLLFVFGLVNTALHYFFFYTGLSYCNASRASILDSLGTFFLVIMACMFFKEEHMSLRKVIGCVLGFSGIIIVNLSGLGGDAFSVMGDGMIVLNALCCALGGVITRIITKKIDALAATGLSLSIGGSLLLLFGILMGGRIPQVTFKGIIILFLLICVSTLGFSLYNQLLCYNPVGKIAIFNSLIPIIGTILSCIILREPFQIKYIFAGALIGIGVATVFREK